jgi:hypothetical protein
VNRRLVLLLALALAALAAGAIGFSRASFTTTSQTQIGASADHVHNWLHLYSQSTDPAGLTGYKTQRVQTGVGPLVATGADETLSLAMGGIRGNNTSYSFNRSFTIQTPATFPNATITQATITATYVVDSATGKQPLRDVRFASGTGGNNPVTLARNTKYQANVRMRASGTGWVVGTIYRPHLIITVTYTGGPTGYYVYDIPLAVTITNW